MRYKPAPRMARAGAWAGSAVSASRCCCRAFSLQTNAMLLLGLIGPAHHAANTERLSCRLCNPFGHAYNVHVLSSRLHVHNDLRCRAYVEDPQYVFDSGRLPIAKVIVV